MRRFGWLLLVGLLWGCGRAEHTHETEVDSRIEMLDVAPGMARLVPSTTVVLIHIRDAGHAVRELAPLLGVQPNRVQQGLLDFALGRSILSLRQAKPWALALARPANPDLGLSLVPVLIVPTSSLTLLELGNADKGQWVVRRDRAGTYASVSALIGAPHGEQAPAIARRLPSGDIGIRIDGPGMQAIMQPRRPQPPGRAGTVLRDAMSGLPGVVRSVLLPLAQHAAEGREMRMRIDLEDGRAQIEAEVLGLSEAAPTTDRLDETATWLPQRAALHAALAGDAPLGRSILGELLEALRGRAFERGTDAAGLIRLERAAEALASGATRLALAADGVPLGGLTRSHAESRPSIAVAAWHSDEEAARRTWHRLYATLGGALEGDPNAPIDLRSGAGRAALDFHAEPGPPLRVSLNRAAPDALPGTVPAQLAELLEAAGAGAQTVLTLQPRRLGRQFAARAAGEPFREDLGREAGDVNTLWVARRARSLELQMVLDLPAWVDLLDTRD